MPDIVMPKLSDSMEQGTILSWLKTSGDELEVDDELLEIETDKATVTYGAEAAGVLEILVEQGATVPVNQPIGWIGARASAPEPEPPQAAPEPEPPEVGFSHTASAAASPLGSAVQMTAAAARPVTHSGNGDLPRRVAATPVARRIAGAHGISLDEVKGTGPLGRITRADVLQRTGLAREAAALPSLRRSAPATNLSHLAATTASAALPPGVRRLELSRLQQLIARRMVEANATIPHFQVQTEVSMDAASALRAELKTVASGDEPVPSYNDIIIKAAAVALREHPLANGCYRDDGLLLHEAVNIGMAVAADESLVVPTVFDAAGKSLGQIARETQALAAAVRSGEITPAQLAGATFTVTNLGMFGMTAITPVINPPQAAILGVGAVRAALARVHDQIVDRTLLTLTLSCDHRILYGADAARFLARIRELLETPLKLAF